VWTEGELKSSREKGGGGAIKKKKTTNSRPLHLEKVNSLTLGKKNRGGGKQHEAEKTLGRGPKGHPCKVYTTFRIRWKKQAPGEGGG